MVRFGLFLFSFLTLCASTVASYIERAAVYAFALFAPEPGGIYVAGRRIGTIKSASFSIDNGLYQRNRHEAGVARIGAARNV